MLAGPREAESRAGSSVLRLLRALLFPKTSEDGVRRVDVAGKGFTKLHERGGPLVSVEVEEATEKRHGFVVLTNVVFVGRVGGLSHRDLLGSKVRLEVVSEVLRESPDFVLGTARVDRALEKLHVLELSLVLSVQGLDPEIEGFRRSRVVHHRGHEPTAARRPAQMDAIGILICSHPCFARWNG